ncbi:hypothetical protein EIN_162270 [Entamoeba invadens IP1]|uniref:START domain-containing protein n=1 Tax=Entamoeba invadens IP1 TaxID=370355 RepID=A0A0A1TYP5_ENTIV|nr:hypothetical protein EIN_162270 [Entamoeba invadens IP1]ELP86593.1 hypothetical protein EIN_162270 [Entamoeba invadens IP1]|eukprot:XP_004185939.1 hypothetical protein EIN_162270 [Entamoeba invadens IP1]
MSTTDNTAFTKEEVMSFKEQLLSNEGWKKLTKEGEDPEVYSKANENKLFTFKIITHQLKDLEPVEIFNAQNDTAYVLSLKSVIVNKEVLEKIDDCNEIIYQTQKMAMLDPRDFVLKTIRYHNKDMTEFITYCKSVDNTIPIKKGTIRATVYIQGGLITKSEKEGTTVYTTSCVDLAGNVPQAIMGETMTKKISKKMVTKIKENVLNYPKWEEQHKDVEKTWLKTLDWMN